MSRRKRNSKKPKNKKNIKNKRNSNLTKNVNERIFSYYKYVPLLSLEQILKNETIKITNPLEFNDPFDSTFPGYNNSFDLYTALKPLIMKQFGGQYGELIRNRQREFKKMIIGESGELYKIINDSLNEIREDWDKLIGEYRVLSLTTQPDNLLMWSHYTNYHNGAVLGFDFTNDEQFTGIKEVEYDSKLLNNFIDSIINGFINLMVKSEKSVDESISEIDNIVDKLKNTNEFSQFFLRKLNTFFYIKNPIWKYEDEYRLVRHKSNTDKGFLKFNSNSLKKVVFGLRAETEKKQQCLELISEKFTHVKISKVTKDNGFLEITDA